MSETPPTPKPSPTPNPSSRPLEGDILPPEMMTVQPPEDGDGIRLDYGAQRVFISRPHPIIMGLALLAVIGAVVVMLIGVAVIWVPLALGMAVLALLANALRRR